MFLDTQVSETIVPSAAFESVSHQYLIVSGIATPITSTTTTMNINKRKTRLHHFPSKLKRIPRNLKGTLEHLITPNLPSNVVLKRQSIRVDFPIPVSPKYKNILY